MNVDKLKMMCEESKKIEKQFGITSKEYKEYKDKLFKEFNLPTKK